MPALPALPKAVCRLFESGQGHLPFPHINLEDSYLNYFCVARSMKAAMLSWSLTRLSSCRYIMCPAG